MKTCYIIGAGNCSVKPKPSEGDLVIAADGGYDTLYNFGMKPDLLVGDLDSIDAVPRGVEIIRHPIKKDETDMHLAYLEGFINVIEKKASYDDEGALLAFREFRRNVGAYEKQFENCFDFGQLFGHIEYTILNLQHNATE